ncbi:MAG: PP2C family serine/threonine-protein phosphatase [Roseiflexaceae bacterium]|nr:PP2C family serine/threonine-protein phosphatase [Roseiflexaceae bacterium]
MSSSSDAPAPHTQNYGTAPLGDLPANPDDRQAPAAPDDTAAPETASHDDYEATKPLGMAYAPADEHVELGSPDFDSQHLPGLLAAALRDVGRVRAVNQDSVYVLVSTIPREENDLLLGLFVVADGMGGHDAGEVASRIAITTVARHILAELLVPALEDNFGAALQQLVIEAVVEANRAIWEYGQATHSDLGTTCTVALVLGRTIYIGHVGDSRAYLLEGDTLRQLTIDHSAVGRLIQLGQLEPIEAREHPLRSQLYRTVGQAPDVHVDLVQRPLGAATHLLLCSDGLWGMVDDTALRDALLQARWPQDACHALIDLANAAGGEDNISALVVQL